MRKLLALAAALAVIGPAALGVAGGDPGFDPSDCRLGANVMPGSPDKATLTVNKPGDASTHPTIQSAVNAASEGDTVLIYPGEYLERVDVVTPGLRIRGTDRHAVVLNGENGRAYAFNVTADRVVLENMTGHNYTGTAFYWHDLTGYWGRNLTAYNNGTYGIYAYVARCGQYDHSVASGNGDSGFYIGGCFPCDAVIEHVESVRNSLGYSGTNAGGNLTLRDSYWHHNGLGIVPNSLNSEPHPPQRGISIGYNQVFDNNVKDVPGTGGPNNAFWGGGIVIAGGVGNEVFGNRVTGHELGGVVLAPLVDTPNLENGVLPIYTSQGNTIWGNYVHGIESPTGADLVQSATSGPGNCWANNDFVTSAPAREILETVWQCSLTMTPPGGDPRLEVQFVLGVAGLNDRVQANPFTYGYRPCGLPGGTIIEPSAYPAACAGSSAAALTSWLPALGLS